MLDVGDASEIHRFMPTITTCIFADTITSLGFDEALPLVSRPMSCHEAIDASPYPAKRNISDRGMLCDKDLSLEYDGWFFAKRFLAYS